MIKLKSIQLTLLLILGVFGSCNKVKETPEPDHFLQTDLLNLALTADGGQTTFDIVSENKIVNESEIKKIDDEIKNEINEIVEFAKNSPEPDESELLTEIYN